MVRLKLVIQAGIDENFDRQAAPDGTPWPPLKRPRRRRRDARAVGGSGQKILYDTGKLRAAATTNIKVVSNRSSMTFTLGPGADYGVFHQLGTKHMPKREFFGFSAAMIEEIEEEAADWLIDQIARLF